jgi:hypothetical protein
MSTRSYHTMTPRVTKFAKATRAYLLVGTQQQHTSSDRQETCGWLLPRIAWTAYKWMHGQGNSRLHEWLDDMYICVALMERVHACVRISYVQSFALASSFSVSRHI